MNTRVGPEDYKETDFENYIEFFRNKQTSQLTIMTGIGIGFLLGIFSISENGLYFLFPFGTLLAILFVFFYKRYNYYYYLEQIALYQAKLFRPSYIKKLQSCIIPRTLQFWTDKLWLIELKRRNLNKWLKGLFFFFPDSKKELILQCFIWWCIFFFSLFSNEFLTFLEGILEKDTSSSLQTRLSPFLMISSLIIFICFRLSGCITLVRYLDENEKKWVEGIIDQIKSKKNNLSYSFNKPDELERLFKKNLSNSLFFPKKEKRRNDELVYLRNALINRKIIEVKEKKFVINKDKLEEKLTEFFNNYHIMLRVGLCHYFFNDLHRDRKFKCINTVECKSS